MRQSDRSSLAEALKRARRLTLSFFEEADDQDLTVPYLSIINPPLWELGHVGWFQEYWCLRWPLPAAAGPAEGLSLPPSSLTSADTLYDSSRVAHATRWSLPLPSLAHTRHYLERSLHETLARLARSDDSDEALYFFRLALFHECMHAEAFAYTWQTLGRSVPGAGRWAMPRVAHPGRMLTLSAGSAPIGRQAPGFSHDNELPLSEQRVDACRIGASVVTNREFQGFVDAQGYQDPQWWTPQAFSTLQAEARHPPRAWVASTGREAPTPYAQRWYGRLLGLDPDAAVVHLDAHEPQAYCRWAGKRLPTEAEWVRAALTLADFDWGNHVWEWTASAFGPLPGFSPGPYRDYSQPWFSNHQVVRGGSFFTPRDMVDSEFRNFYRPERADPFLGFRVCD